MSIVQSIQEVGPCRKQLTIEIPAAEVETERSKVLRELGRSASIPGFRKGKVPVGVLRRRFGGRVDREIVDRLVPRYWEQARKEAELEPLLPPEVQEVGDLHDGEPLIFVATVEARPVIELGDLEGFDLPDPPVEPTGAEIEQTLEDLRRQAAPWVPAERPAARGDRVTAEITEIPEGGEEAGVEAQSIDIEVGDPRVWEELSLAVTGLTAGQEARFSHRGRPETAAGEGGGAPRERHYRVQVTGVQERELPPLDDELAGRIGRFESLEELRTDVTHRLAAQKRSERDDRRREALLEQLRRGHPLSLPRGVVEREIEGMVRSYAESLSRQGVDIEKAQIDWQQVGEQARPRAEGRVHERLLLDAIADREAVAVAPSELEEALAVLARAQGTNVAVVRRALTESDRLEDFRNRLRRDKVVRRLLGEEPEPGAAEPAAEPEP